MLEILKCGQCGGELDEVSSGVYRCACCGNLYTKKEQDVEAAFRASLGDERYARLSAARQNLWTAMHAEFVSGEACLNYARELKSYAPSDYYANFAETVNGQNDRDISDFLNGSSAEDMDKYADAVLDFMLKSLTPRTLNAVCGYIDRAFELTSKEHTKYVNLYETEAQRVSEGIYELTTPRSVFLAYSGEDYMYVTDLCDFLEDEGITCFVSTRNLRHGRGAADNYEKALKTAMDNCSVFVFVSSKNSRNLSCDALRLEMTYIRERDRRNAPPEYRTLPYDRIPATYKTRRVEYLVDEYGKKPTSADGVVKEFFSGLEWRKTREEVSDSVLVYLLGMTEDDSGGKDVAVPDSVSAELSTSMEKKEKNILEYVKKLMSIGDFDGAEKRLGELIYDEYSELGRCSAAVYYYEILVSYRVVSEDELIDRIVSKNLDFSADKNYILAKSCEDGEYRARILEIERMASEIAADREYARTVGDKAARKPTADTVVAEKEEETVTPEVLIVSPETYKTESARQPSESLKTGDGFVPNPKQLEAVMATEGPVLITAGPGTGKTATLVQRILHLIRDLDVKPREMFVSTFTDKAAKELITRISDVLTEPTLNIGDMYVGTFHSLCKKILDENIGETGLRHNYDLLDEFGQKYFVFRHIGEFKKIQGYETVVNTKGYGQYEKSGDWNQAGEICGFVNKLSEDLVDADELLSSGDPRFVAAGEVMKTYDKLLSAENCTDFAGLQTECYRLLREKPRVLSKLREQIKYIMIDEYQDTNYIQEQIVFLLGGKSGNICVVGDDDQGIYRFRGATVRNIIEFPEKIRKTGGKCTEIKLLTNYRSDAEIVEFYNKWMDATSGDGFSFRWGNYRIDKKIEPHEERKIKSHAVVKLSAPYDADKRYDKWYEKIYGFVTSLMDTGKICDYNQVAFLFKSAKSPAVKGLSDYLERRGINVYSPRSLMFFERDEIRLAVGCLLKLFPMYEDSIRSDEKHYMSSNLLEYYRGCVDAADELIERPENQKLSGFISRYRNYHNSCRIPERAKYAVSGLLYQILGFSPFSDWMSVDLKCGKMKDLRPVRDLGRLTQIVSDYEKTYKINEITASNLKRVADDLFGKYLRVLYSEGVGDYEDESEYAPTGCVSFMTIHQSKGMEFPVVFVGSLDGKPGNTWSNSGGIASKAEERYFPEPPFEPEEFSGYYDFWRVFYVAFSRAQNLLVLTCAERDEPAFVNEFGREVPTVKIPSSYFEKVYRDLPDADGPSFDAEEFDFAKIKNVRLKESFSLTSHIAVYDRCPVQYKFYKELGFRPLGYGTLAYGTLVHQTIEDINRAAIRGDKDSITEENIVRWFEDNYESVLPVSVHAISHDSKVKALDQVQMYAESESDTWDDVEKSEVDVALVKKDYIINGRVDLVRRDGDGVRIYDFKTEGRPDREHLDDYRRQLQLYAYLLEEQGDDKVNGMSVYFTEEWENPEESFPNNKEDVGETVRVLEDTVYRILGKDFSGTAKDPKACAGCGLRFYCIRTGKIERPDNSQP